MGTMLVITVIKYSDIYQSSTFILKPPESRRMAKINISSSLRAIHRWDGPLVGYNESPGLREFEEVNPSPNEFRLKDV